jgi:flagellar basal-body rod protein FlgC
MDYYNSFAISAAGLAVEKLRLETAALNLANADATAAPGTEAYKAMTVLNTPDGSFSHYLSADGLSGTAVNAQVVPRTEAPRMTYEPGHPHANAEGFVAHANVDSLSEMMTILRATRAYEANIKAINAAKAMALHALDIGGSK